MTGLRHLGIDERRVLAVDHHLSHAYTAYSLSPHEKATVLVVDGAGNAGDTETVYHATPAGIVRVAAAPAGRPRAGGIGATYEAFTNYLGWHEQEAGKVMALAAYGSPNAATTEPLFDVDGAQVRGRLNLTHQEGVAEFAARTGADFGPAGGRGRGLAGADAAAYLQHHTETALVRLAGAAIALTGEPRLAMAGGVALNCVANEAVRASGARDLFVPPPASDRGQALGNALAAWHRATGEIPRRPVHADSFGRTYSDAEIEAALRREPASGLVERRRCAFSWRGDADIARTAAQMVAEGQLVGWHQGGSELGPRALGHRCILADPRTVASRDTLNTRVKHREGFRPFAPAVLSRAAEDWFTPLSAPSLLSPFMLGAPRLHPVRADLVPAVVHVDGTARAQLVDPDHEPLFARLITEFHRLTGVPMVLCTSFNDTEPIVETPAHALATFQATELDALCIGDYLAEKAPSRQNGIHDRP
nr:carbamoyltransferase C-terminal domain-containing protein [Streptomonospora nanhaiensis]